MYCLEVIRKINDRAEQAPASETETTRHCSYCGDIESGLVLHSAKQRSTVFVPAGAESRVFLSAWFGTNSAEQRDALVENYF